MKVDVERGDPPEDAWRGDPPEDAWRGGVQIAWATLFVRGLVNAGVRDVVISPGSRSTPLVLAAAAERALRVHVVIDERAAAFFALGQARLTGVPSVVMCTSGTAPAHWLPAVIEASEAFVPIVVVSADRPSELIGVRAPQAIDQLRLFGAHVRASFEIGPAAPSEAALRGALRLGAQAVSRAMSPEPGAVHINVRLTKPLEPPARGVDQTPPPWRALWASLLSSGTSIHAPGPSTPRPEDVRCLAHLVAAEPLGLCVAGPLPATTGMRVVRALAGLAARAGYPLLAEITSQVGAADVRSGDGPSHRFDAYLRDPATRARLRPRVVIELGDPPTSSAYATWMAELGSSVTRVILREHGFSDPHSTAAHVFLGEPATLLERAIEALPPADDARTAHTDDWVAAFGRAERAAAAAIHARASSGDELTEGRAARVICAELGPARVLSIGNSGPLRDADLWADGFPAGVRILHQRGANGIDGLIAGAAGARSASAEPVVLFLGDVSALHDLGGLVTATRTEGAPLVIVVVNNDGGRLFEDLALAERPWLKDTLERLFCTPHGASIAAVAAALGCASATARTVPELRGQLRRLLSTRAPVSVIEALVPPHEGAAARRGVRTDIAVRLASDADFAKASRRGEPAR